MSQPPYLDQVLEQVPRLLSRADRDPFSSTCGSFDRTYWAWKFTDFAGARFQEAACALARLYRLKAPGNPLAGHPLAFEWARAAMARWRKLQYADGSFDEAYPFEHSLAATAFTGFYVGDAFLLLEEEIAPAERSKLVGAFRKAADWLCRNDETHGVLSNHLAAAAAALAVIERITGEARFGRRAGYFVQRIYDRQSPEGWYEEYGGADPGYQTHGTFYLARLWQLTGDETLLDSLRRANAFLAHFIHPDGTIGGEYGSRNTEFYFPAGFEILAPVCGAAASIAAFMRRSVALRRCAGLHAMDAYNLLPLLNNYLFAAEAARSLAMAAAPAPLPCFGTGERDFPLAGLLVVSTPEWHAVVGLSKGGVIKAFRRTPDGARLVASDCGWWARLRGGAIVSSQVLDRTRDVKRENGAIVVRGRFAAVNQRVMTPWLFLGFRLFCLTVGRSGRAARRLKALLVNILVVRRRPAPLSLTRAIRLEPARLVIEDRVATDGAARVEEIRYGNKFASIHMGSARYFQRSELEAEPARDYSESDADALNATGSIVVRREWSLAEPTRQTADAMCAKAQAKP